jgi:hypothetical protein
VKNAARLTCVHPSRKANPGDEGGAGGVKPLLPEASGGRSFAALGARPNLSSLGRVASFAVKASPLRRETSDRLPLN